MGFNVDECLRAGYTGAPIMSLGVDRDQQIRHEIEAAMAWQGRPQPPPPSQCVPEALGALEKQLCAALDRMGELMERLGPVLKPEPPSVNADRLDNLESRSPLSDRLELMSRKAGEITDMIQRIFGRLDI